MTHPLAEIVAETQPLLLIGDADADRFPATSFHAYTVAGKPFYCLDLSGLHVSRGQTSGATIYTSVAELPDDVGDLAHVWVHPKRAVEAVEVAHQAGCRRVWFSFKTGHPDAVARAEALGMTVVEVGRCPALYLENASAVCKVHQAAARMSGLLRQPPRTTADPSRRELL